MPVRASTARGQKRKRSAEVDPATESTPPPGSTPPDFTPPPEPPWKRAGFRSAEEANTAFWDNLSKVPLFPRALKELDRRNSLAVGPPTESAARSTPRPTTRSAARRAAQVDQLSRQRSTVLEDGAAQLKRFARQGGPDLHHLRGYPEPVKAIPTMPPRKTPYKTPSDSTKSTSQIRRKTSAYNAGFELNLIRHGVYPSGYEYTDDRTTVYPENWDEIQQRLAERRPSLSPSRFSDGAFSGFRRKTDRAVDEADMMANAFPILRGEDDIPSGFKKTFGTLTVLTDGTLVDAQPDFYYGARPNQLEPRVQKDLNSYIIPSANYRVPVLPNNFTEAKGPGGTRAVVKRQACYDGALGARGMQQLQSYGQPEPVYDNNAYTITSTFDGESFHMYTTHPTAPANLGDRPEYHMNQLGAFAMTHNPETFRQGATAYRNGRDWAKERRDEFIEAANGRMTSLPQDLTLESSGYSEPSTSTNMAILLEPDTSADELALECVSTIPGSGNRLKRENRRGTRGPAEEVGPRDDGACRGEQRVVVSNLLHVARRFIPW